MTSEPLSGRITPGIAIAVWAVLWLVIGFVIGGLL